MNRGHLFHDLVEVYPLRLVILLHKAVQQNRGLEMVTMANAVSAGISHSLDLAFNSGEGNIMKRYGDLLLKTETPARKQAVSERAAAFLGSLPVKKVGRG